VKPVIRFRALCLALVALAACTSPKVNTVESAQPSEDAYQKIVFSDQLDEKVRIQHVNTRTLDGFLQVQVDLVNLTRDKTTFEYAYEWFDTDGMQVAPSTSIWTQATVYPGETRSFPATAGTKAATDFRFKIKSK
jgi:uncharacterized protein YcfL